MKGKEEMKYLRFKDLRPGDVLLCRGAGLISDLVVLFDGGTYSHAAFFDGEAVVQATLHGVVRDSIDTLKEEIFVDVFRFKKDGHLLDSPGWPSGPVVSVADKIGEEGLKYATDHLLILALLTLTRRIPLEPLEKKILRVILDHAANLLFEWMDKGKEPMVCSEVVFRAFKEAAPHDKYTLIIKGVLFNFLKKLGPSSFADDDFGEAQRKFFEAWVKAKFSQASLPDRLEVIDPAVASCVTPHDLETSPTLFKVGRYVFS